jgi:hypothetical protein
MHPNHQFPVSHRAKKPRQSRNFCGAPVFPSTGSSAKLKGFSATPAETCAAVPKGRRHFLFFAFLEAAERRS